MAYAPRTSTVRWINEELTDEAIRVVVAASVADLVARVAERPTMIAIVDFDALTEADIQALLNVRGDRWTGALIALGRVESDLRQVLGVRETVLRPFGSERLRKAMSEIRVSKATESLPAIRAAG